MYYDQQNKQNKDASLFMDPGKTGNHSWELMQTRIKNKICVDFSNMQQQNLIKIRGINKEEK